MCSSQKCIILIAYAFLSCEMGVSLKLNPSSYSEAWLNKADTTDTPCVLANFHFTTENGKFLLRGLNPSSSAPSAKWVITAGPDILSNNGTCIESRPCYISLEEPSEAQILGKDQAGFPAPACPEMNASVLYVNINGTYDPPLQVWMYADFDVQLNSSTCIGETSSNVCFAQGNTTYFRNDIFLKGDPHVKNMRGKGFDVHTEGNLPLIVLPNTNVGETKMLVEGKIQGYAGECGPTFITAVRFSGSWFNENITIESGGPDSMSQEFAVKKNAVDLWTSTKECSAQSCSLLSDGRLTVLGENTKSSKKQVTVTTKDDENNPITISIVHQKWARRYRAALPHLDIHIDQMQFFAKHWEVGGILGNSDDEDFSYWTKQPKNCPKVLLSNSASRSLESEIMLSD